MNKSNKNLTGLNDQQLNQMPESYLSNLKGGIVETRRDKWTAHGDHEDHDGYGGDLHA